MSAASAENEAVVMRWSTWMAAYSTNGMQQYSPGPAMRLKRPKRKMATRSQWGATRTDVATTKPAATDAAMVSGDTHANVARSTAKKPRANIARKNRYTPPREASLASSSVSATLRETSASAWPFDRLNKPIAAPLERLAYSAAAASLRCRTSAMS